MEPDRWTERSDNVAKYGSGDKYGTGVKYAKSQPSPLKWTLMNGNITITEMTDIQRDAMLADLNSFDTKFTPFECDLTPEEIRGLSKLSPQEIAILDAALTYAQQNPSALPANINIAQLITCIALAKQITPIDAKAQQEAAATHTTLIAVMSVGFDIGREIYRVAQARGRTPQTIPFLDTFGQHFAHGPHAAAAKAKPA